MDKKSILHQLNTMSSNTLLEALSIEFIELGEDFLTAKMPVSSTVHQPFGILHGGASAALAESVASSASYVFLNDPNKIVNGIELSINHLKSKRDGEVFATAKSIHIGRTTHLWEVRITDEENNLISLCKMTNIVLEKKS